MYFEAKLSGAVKMITAVFLTLLLFLLAVGLYYSVREFFIGDVKNAVVGFIYGVLFIVGIGFLAVRDWVSGYSLTPEKLEIHRPWQGNESIPLKNLEKVECIKDPFRKTLMIGANGGLGGFYGDFKQIGGLYFTAYVTDPKRCVMLTMKGDERIVISPRERERFLAALAELRPDVKLKTA